MANNETLSIDIKKLSKSLKQELKEFDTLYPPLSKDRCISRVHRQQDSSHSKDHYTPEVVSIGPLHHGNKKKKLEDMEKHKIRYLQYFLHKRTRVGIEDFLTLIKKNEIKLSNCYSDIIHKKGDDFVKMILLDAIFLIEYFWRGYESEKSQITDDEDLLFGEPRIEVIWDLLLVENQIPLFILNDLFNLAKTSMSCARHEGLSLITITRWFRKKIADYIPLQQDLLETNFTKARHILDMLSLCFQPSTRKMTSAKKQNIPSIKQLHQAGMKIIKAPSNKNLLDITFNNGILEIPFLNIYDNTERIYRNVIAFEHMHLSTSYFNDYVLMMSFLISTAKDADLLVQKEVIGRRYRKTLSTVFSSLSNTCDWSLDFQYSGVVEKLNDYCGSRLHKWKAIFKEKYFNTPWASMSVAAAVILLLLTVVQTTCSILAL